MGAALIKGNLVMNFGGGDEFTGSLAEFAKRML